MYIWDKNGDFGHQLKKTIFFREHYILGTKKLEKWLRFCKATLARLAA